MYRETVTAPLPSLLSPPFAGFIPSGNTNARSKKENEKQKFSEEVGGLLNNSSALTSLSNFNSELNGRQIFQGERHHSLMSHYQMGAYLPLVVPH